MYLNNVLYNENEKIVMNKIKLTKRNRRKNKEKFFKTEFQIASWLKKCFKKFKFKK